MGVLRHLEDIGTMHEKKKIASQTPNHLDGCQDEKVFTRLAKTNKHDINTKQLDRAMQRECALWKGIAINAKNERTTKSKRIKTPNEVKLSKYCPKSVHLKRSCVKSHKVFSMS